MGITSAISDWASAYSAKVGKIISYIDNIMGMPVISDLLDELFSMYYYSYEIDQVEEMESADFLVDGVWSMVGGDGGGCSVVQRFA